MINLTVRCTKDPDHAKVLRFRDSSFEEIARLARLLDGTSENYIYKPGPDSPIGKCAICGAPYECTVSEIDPNAKPE